MLVLGLKENVSMAVDQTRKHCVIRQIDNLGSLRNLNARPGLFDATIAHENDCVVHGRAIGWVEQATASDRQKGCLS